MADHLATPSLLGYAGEHFYRLPAEADCTEGGLWHGKFGEDGPNGDRSGRRGQVLRQADQLTVFVPQAL